VNSAAVLASWSLEPGVLLSLIVAALLYLRGWLRLRRQAPHRFGGWRLASYLSGLTFIYLAIASPLDPFANFLLSIHMVQHLMLTMLIPPLLLFGNPFLPTLVGLPRTFRREAVQPFLSWPPLKRLGATLTDPRFTWCAFILSNIVWHVPCLYELALRDEAWHRIEHTSFLLTAILFWWPIIQPFPSHSRFPRWAMIPYLLLADLQNTALAAFISFYGKVIYPTYAEAPRISWLSAVDDQAAAGAIMWVPGSMAFLAPAGLIAIQFLSPKRRHPTPPLPRPKSASAQTPPSPSFDILRIPIAGRLLRTHGRRALQIILLLLAGLVVWDGFRGSQVSAMNLAGVLPWTHWRGFTVIALFAVGNLFCMACPFMLVRDWNRRLLSLLPFRIPNLTWPRRLRSKWLPVALLAIYLWAYEAFSLWDTPWWTSAIIAGYFVAATLVDGIFKGASFCKYVCPIGQFHFVQSLASPFEIKVRDPGICQTCRTYDCIRGNEKQRGCELQLFQPKKSGNMDCTFCLDCTTACPHENVGMLPVVPGSDLWQNRPRSSVGRYDKRLDLAALVALLTFGAFANAAGMISPVVALAGRLGLSHFQFSTLFLLLTLLILPTLLLPATAAQPSPQTSRPTPSPWRPLDSPCGLPILSSISSPPPTPPFPSSSDSSARPQTGRLLPSRGADCSASKSSSWTPDFSSPSTPAGASPNHASPAPWPASFHGRSSSHCFTASESGLSSSQWKCAEP